MYLSYVVAFSQGAEIHGLQVQSLKQNKRKGEIPVLVHPAPRTNGHR